MLHALRYVAVRHREHSGAMGCDVSRVIGYRASCSCEWRGSVRGTIQEARRDGTAHVGATAAHGTSSDAR